MSFTFLEQLESGIDGGVSYYACPGTGMNEWFISQEIEKCRQKAKRTANGQKHEATIYRLIDSNDVTHGDVFLVVRKILDMSARGEANIKWMLVDTKEGAELMRDISQGVTPYFGATFEESCQPDIIVEELRRPGTTKTRRR